MAHTADSHHAPVHGALPVFIGKVGSLGIIIGSTLLLGVGGLSFINGVRNVKNPKPVVALESSVAAPVAASVAEAEGVAAEGTPAATPEPTAPVVASEAAPADAGQAAEVTISAVTGLQFDVKEFKVKAGQKVKLTLKNPDVMQHNLVVGKVGSEQKIIDASMKMMTDMVNALKNGYVPQVEEILFHSKLLNPQENEVIEFTAPAEAGEYPYLCTFPGHAMLMKGKMIVE